MGLSDTVLEITCHGLFVVHSMKSKIATVLPTKSDSNVILCLQLLSKILTCTPHLS